MTKPNKNGVKYRVAVKGSAIVDYTSFDDLPEDLRVYIATLDAAATVDGLADIEGIGSRCRSVTYDGAAFYDIEGSWA